MVSAARRSMLNVQSVVLEHIDHLDGVSPGQTARYRQYVRDQMGGVFGLTARVRSLTTKKLAPKTVKNIHGL